MVSQGERYGFVDWEIHFWLPKKQKIGLSYTDFVICLYIKLLQKYNPHWNLHWNLHWTRTGTYTDKYCFGFPPTDFGFTRNQVMMTRMKRTKRMVWWVSLRFHYKDTTKNSYFQILENICRIPSDKVLYTWTAEGTMEHINTRQCLPIEEIPRTVVVNHVPHERIFESPVFSVIKTQTPKWVSVWVPVWVPV